MKTIYIKLPIHTIISFVFIIYLAIPPVRAGEVPRAGKPEYTFKLAAVAPEGTSWADTGAKFKKYVEENSGGRVRVTWYLGGIMGDEPDVIRKIHLGQLQGGGFTNVGLALMVPETQILLLPFLFNNPEEIDFIYQKMQIHFQRLFEEHGFVLAGWLEVGFNYWFTKNPIATPADFPSCRMWAWPGDQVNTEINQVLGFQNIPVPLIEVLTALQTGMVNSFYGPLYAILALQWYTHARYFIDLPFSYTPAGIAMDKKFMDGLPPELRRIILDGWNLYLPDLVKRIRQDNVKTYQSLKTKMKFTCLNMSWISIMKLVGKLMFQLLHCLMINIFYLSSLNLKRILN